MSEENNDLPMEAPETGISARIFTSENMISIEQDFMERLHQNLLDIISPPPKYITQYQQEEHRFKIELWEAITRETRAKINALELDIKLEDETRKRHDFMERFNQDLLYATSLSREYITQYQQEAYQRFNIEFEEALKYTTRAQVRALELGIDPKFAVEFTEEALDAYATHQYSPLEAISEAKLCMSGALSNHAEDSLALISLN